MTADRTLANLRRPTEHSDSCDGWLRHGVLEDDCNCRMRATGPSWDEAEEAAEEIEALRWALQEACDDGWTDGEAAAEAYLRKARAAAVRRALGEDDQ